MKIDEAPPVSTPTGAEKLPCSVSGAPKSITAAQIAALAGLPALATYLGGASAADPALAADAVLALRAGAAVKIPLSAVGALLAASYDEIGAAGALVGANTLRLVQSGAAKSATLADLAAFVAGTLPASHAALSEATPASGDSLLLVRVVNGVALLRRLPLPALAAWLATGSSEAQAVPGVVVRSATASISAQSGSIGLGSDFDIPAGARLLAVRACVDSALSCTRLAEDAEEGAVPDPVEVAPVLSIGSHALSVPAAAASAPALVLSAALDSAPSCSFTLGVSEATGYVYSYSGSVRVSATWEEPAALEPLPAP